MSESFAHEGGADPRASGPGESLDAELEAEIADHLAAAAGELMRRGETPDAAAQLARGRFGDVERIKRQCWWIQKGDEVMFRTLGIGLLSLLAIGVVVVAVGGWQLQRNFAARTEELSAQLASLTKTQQAMLAQQRPPEITGHCYLGDPSKPAADVEVKVYRFSEIAGLSSSRRGLLVRRVRTDSDGRFQTGVLTAGDYSLLAPLQAPSADNDVQALLFAELQTRPQFLTTGSDAPPEKLDVLASAHLRLEYDESIPDVIPFGDHEFPVSRNIYVGGACEFPTPPTCEPPNERWPLPGGSGVAQGYPSKLPQAYYIPAGTYPASASISIGRPAPKGKLAAPPSARPGFWAFWALDASAGVAIGADGLPIPSIPSVTVNLPSFEVTARQPVTCRLKLSGDPLEKRVAAAFAKLGITDTASPEVKTALIEVAQELKPDLQLEVTIDK
ncbi:MAG: hypothetical protein HYX69_17545 [Planctomycetia bacterium]|nr:hypothetical protein [Planctomycetia bacterium]